MAKHLAAARQKALGHPHNDAEIHLRRAKVRELWGTFTTDALMFQAVNAHMESLGFPSVSNATLYADKKIVGAEFNQVFAEDRDNRAAYHAQRLELLSSQQWEDYQQQRAEGGNVAPLSDALRKTILTQAQLDGTAKVQHEHTGNMTFEMRLKEELSKDPGPMDVLELLPDEEYSLTPPKITADA